jgi:hypothetical protein
MKKQILLLILIMVSVVFTGISDHRFEVAAKETGTLEKCAIPPFGQAYKFSKAVFIGKVLSVREEDSKKIFEFKVEKYWKGIKAKNVEVGIYETTRYQAWYKVGGRYLVFARATDDGKLIDGRCSRSKDAADSNAADDLKQLGKGKIMR